MGNHLGQHVVVIGGSLTGLMTARVLADHFAHVTVLERDHIDEHPTIHKSIPQGNHYHAVLFDGQGERTPNIAESARYFAALNVLATEDLEVHKLLGEVFHLAKPLSVLMEEPLRSRALAQLQKQASV